VDGWQQGWIIPSGPGGTIALAFTPERAFQISLMIGAGALLLVLLAALLPRHRHPSYIPGRHRLRREGLHFFGGVALILVGGWAGLVIAVASVLIALLARHMTRRMPVHEQVKVRRATRWLWLLPPALFLLGGWPTGAPSYGADQLWPQLASLAAVITLWLSAYWPGSSRPRAIPAADWSLNAVPADGSEDQADHHGQRVEAKEALAEVRPG
jgi:arabinofuranan 3-O-arabinosyltransferase